MTFTSTRALLTKVTEDAANWQDEPSVRSEFVFCRMHDWALLGRMLNEMSDQANAQADATDDVDGEAWDKIVEVANDACGCIYPNGLEYPPLPSTPERRLRVRELLTGLLQYLS
jgi:hypothetical protein